MPVWITVADIEKMSREFWAAQEEPHGEPALHPGIAALVREAHQLEIRATHDQQRTARTAAAIAEVRDKGDATRYAVLTAAQRIVDERGGTMFRTDLARLVATEVVISTEHALRILKDQARKEKRGRSTV